MMLLVAIYIAGETRLDCVGLAQDGPASAAAEADCRAEEKRFLGLVSMQSRAYEGVTAAHSQPPALGRSDFWLSLEGRGETARVLAGSERRTAQDVERFNLWLRESSPEPLTVRRSTWLWAFGAALFGGLWIFVISLIMREFLGYHTPWWWRVLGRRA